MHHYSSKTSNEAETLTELKSIHTRGFQTVVNQHANYNLYNITLLFITECNQYHTNTKSKKSWYNQVILKVSRTEHKVLHV